jgi:histidinol-phosphatase (PHP family)
MSNMKKIIANYHTHTKLCGHAIGMSEDYVKQALERGFLEIGISDHGPIPRSWMSPETYDAMWLSRQMDFEMYKEIYLPDLERTIKKYGHLIKIYKGVEIEYIEGYDDYYQALLKDLDYLALGMHFFKYKGKFCNTYEEMDIELLKQYALTAQKAMESGLFKIFVHPDLFMYNYVLTESPLVFDEICEEVAKDIIEAAIKNDVYLEVNAGGVAKGKISKDLDEYYYPRSEFWKIVKRYPEAKVIIGCDAHKPSALDDDALLDTLKFVEEIGLKVESKVMF